MDAVEEIKERLSIENVVGRHVDLKQSGASLKGLCPFHQEKTPSFYVTPARGTYHCFGCGRGGDAFSFVMEADKLSFPEALKTLAGQAGVTLPERETRQPSLTKRLYEANAEAAIFFHETLGGTRGGVARTYLQQRGFGAEAVERFDLGCAGDSRDALVQHLRARGYDDRILLAAGLVLQDEASGAMRDRFRNRLLFPIRDRSGRVTGFGGRTLGDAQPKYLNSPQTEVFDKSSVLFGIQLAHDAIRQAGRAVLVEGYLDAVRAHLGGFSYTVASLGTAVTVQQLTALSRMTETVIIALDPDVAGLAAAARTCITALAEVTRNRGRSTPASGSLDVRIARLSDDHGDPDELIRDQPDVWERVLAQSVSAFEFYFDHTLRSLDRSRPDWQQDAINAIVPMIQTFSGAAAKQGIWMQRLATETGIDPRYVLRSIPAAAPAPRRSRRLPTGDSSTSVVGSTTSRAMTTDPMLAAEKSLLSLLLKLVVIPYETSRLLMATDLSLPEHRIIVEELQRWRESGNYDYQTFRERLSDEARTLADVLRQNDYPLPPEGKVSVDVASHLARILKFRIEAQLARVTNLMPDTDRDGAKAAMAEVLKLNGQRQYIDQTLDRLSRWDVDIENLTTQGTIDQDSGRL